MYNILSMFYWNWSCWLLLENVVKVGGVLKLIIRGNI